MNTTIPIFVTALAVCLAGCDLGLGQREARRTVVGVSPPQVTRAAQQVLAAEGFDLAAVFPRDGNLRTAWREGPRMRLACAVDTSPLLDEDGKEIPGAFTVAVSCTAQDRVVGGWSEEYVSGHRTRAILRDVTRLLFEAPPPIRRAVHPEPRSPAKPEAPAKPEVPAEPEATKRPVEESAADDEPAEDAAGDGGKAAEEVTP